MAALHITVFISFRILHQAQDLELSAMDKPKQATAELGRPLRH